MTNDEFTPLKERRIVSQKEISPEHFEDSPYDAESVERIIEQETLRLERSMNLVAGVDVEAVDTHWGVRVNITWNFFVPVGADIDYVHDILAVELNRVTRDIYVGDADE